MGVCDSAPKTTDTKTESLNKQSPKIRMQNAPSQSSNNDKGSFVPNQPQRLSTFPTNKNSSQSSIDRLLIVLHEYHKVNRFQRTNDTNNFIYFQKIYGGNADYNAVWLINDFNCILDEYNDDYEIDNLFKKLCFQIDCNTQELNDFGVGSIGHRHLITDIWSLKNTSDLKKLYFSLKDINDIIQCKILDKIYCHIMYSQMLGMRLSLEESETLENADYDSEEKVHDNGGYNNIDIDPAYHKLDSIVSDKREQWYKLKGIEWMKRYNDTKFVTALDEEKSNDNNKNDKNKNNAFTIGNHYYYDEWQYYKKNQTKLGLDPSMIVNGKQFPDLKSEMCEGNNDCLSNDQWNLIYSYCKVLYASKRCKKMKCDIYKADGHAIDVHFAFKQDDCILLEHLICIYIFTNYAMIKATFCDSKHFMDNKFANLGMLLRESVEAFGVSVFHDSSHTAFYHNINVTSHNISESAYFNGHLALTFCKPTLMTPHQSLINLYNSNNKYMTLELCRYGNYSTVNYFECDWISEYSGESQCLFIGGKYALQLQSILIDNFYNFSHYLRAIHVLSNLVKGKANVHHLDDKLLMAIEGLTVTKLKKANMPTNKGGAGGVDDDNKENDEVMGGGSGSAVASVNEYVMSLFSRFCANITIPIYVNLIWVLDSSDNGYFPIKQWIVNDDVSWIRFDTLCALFPNVETVKIGHSQFMLKKETMDMFIQFFGNEQNDNLKLKEIIIEDPNEKFMTVKSIVQQYSSKLTNQIKWKLESNKYYTKLFFTKKANNLWDDLF